MTDETQPTPQPAPQPERSWAPETGWPDPPSTPAWAEPPAEEGSDEDEYEAWLDAQDLPAELEHPVERAGTPPLPPEPEESTPGVLEQEAYEEQAEEPAQGDPEDEPSTDEPRYDEPRYDERAATAEVMPDEAEAGVDQAPAPEPVGEAAADDGGPDDGPEVEPAAYAEPGEVAPAELAPAELAPAAVEAPVVVPDGLEAAATPLEIETEPSGEPPPVPDQPAATDAASAAEASAVEEDQPPAVPAFRSGVPLVAPLAVFVVLLAALTTVLAVWSARTSGGGATEKARREALAAARSASRVLFSYDYRHLDKDFAAGKAVTTGTFATDYQRTTSKIVSDVAPRYKAVVVADVSDAAVVSATPSTVQVLVFVNQQSTSSLAAGRKVTQSRLTMTLVRKHGRWLVAKVNAF